MNRNECISPSSLPSNLPSSFLPVYLSIYMSGECIISLVLSCYSKGLKQQMDQCYSCFIWQAKKNISSRHEGGWSKRQKRREARGSILAPLFRCFFLLPLSLPYVNWASQESCLLYLMFSLQSSDLPLFYFRGLSLSLSFSHHHYRLLFPILNTEHICLSIYPSIMAAVLARL